MKSRRRHGVPTLRAGAKAGGLQGSIRSWDLCFGLLLLSLSLHNESGQKAEVTRGENQQPRTTTTTTSLYETVIQTTFTHQNTAKMVRSPRPPTRKLKTNQNPRAGVHLRRQLPRRETSLVIPQIILRPRTTGLHEAHGQIPHPQHSAHRCAGRQADRRPGRGVVANDAGARSEEATAR